MFKVWINKFRWIIVLALILCLFTTSCSGFNVNKVKDDFVKAYNTYTEEDISVDDLLVFGKYGDGYVVQYAENIPEESSMYFRFNITTYKEDGSSFIDIPVYGKLYYFVGSEIFDFFSTECYKYMNMDTKYYFCYPYLMGYIDEICLEDIYNKVKDTGYIRQDYNTVIKSCKHNVKYNIDKESTCIERGIISYYCTKCDKVLRKENLKLKHHNIVNDKCLMCNEKPYECLEEDTDITNSINEDVENYYRYRYMGGIKYNDSNIYIYDKVEYFDGEYRYKNKTHSYTPNYKYDNYEFVLKSGGQLLSEVKDGKLSAGISIDDSMAIYQLYKQYYENMNMEEPSSTYDDKLELEYFNLIYPLRENLFYAFDLIEYYDGLYVYLSNYYLHLHFANNDFSCEINGYNFEFETNEQIYVYDGKNNITLKEAWDNNLLTEEQLSSIYKKSLDADVWY